MNCVYLLIQIVNRYGNVKNLQPLSLKINRSLFDHHLPSEAEGPFLGVVRDEVFFAGVFLAWSLVTSAGEFFAGEATTSGS